MLLQYKYWTVNEELKTHPEWLPLLDHCMLDKLQVKKVAEWRD